MEQIVAEASDLEIVTSDRALIRGEIDALWDEANVLMSWLVERPTRQDN